MKKKKERRKQRAKVAKAENEKKAKVQKVAHASDESSEDEDDDEDEEMNVDHDAPTVVEDKEKKKDKKVKKRQKLDPSLSRNEDLSQAESTSRQEADVDEREEGDEAEDIQVEPSPSARTPAEAIEPEIPLGALPSFPLPSRPDAPSKSTLALQGLDKHITEAEIVHPSTVLPIPGEVGEDGGTRLSEKTRKRLKDLGITELFAGKRQDTRASFVVLLDQPRHSIGSSNSAHPVPYSRVQARA